MNRVVETLFAAPWWVSAIVAAGVIAFLVFALARGNRKLGRAAGAAVTLVALWLVLGLMIHTPVERASDRTQDIVAAYERADWAALGGLLDPETRFANLLKGPDIVSAAELTRQELAHEDVRVLSVESERDPLGIRVSVRVFTQPRLVTAWRFDYRKRGDEWKLERIDPLPTDQIDPATILRNVRIPPELANGRR